MAFPKYDDYKHLIPTDPELERMMDALNEKVYAPIRVAAEMGIKASVDLDTVEVDGDILRFRYRLEM